MFSLTTPTHNQKLLNFGIILVWYHLLPCSFLSPMKQSFVVVFPGPALWVIKLITFLSKPLKLLYWHCSSVLYSSESLKRAQVRSSLHIGNFFYSMVLSETFLQNKSNVTPICPTTRTQKINKRENHTYSS